MNLQDIETEGNVKEEVPDYQDFIEEKADTEVLATRCLVPQVMQNSRRFSFINQ